MTGRKSKLASVLLTCGICLAGFNGMVYGKTYSQTDLEQTADKIIHWQVTDNDLSTVFQPNLLMNAGEESSDWFAIGVSRLDKKANYLDYQALLSYNVEKRYNTKELLSSSKSTEWHRIALAYLATGGNPTSVSFDRDQSINLIEDGTYNRGKVTQLEKQGTNGLIFALITLDSMNYEVPDSAQSTRKEIIERLLSAQNKDGGYGLSMGSPSDVDMTAMALIALAPYVNSEETWRVNEEDTVRVADKVTEALTYLSQEQKPTGGFETYGVSNPESAVQVIIALTTLNIDPETDKRFIKKNHTLIDCLMTFQMTDGGFIHSFDYDKSNPTSKPNESNQMASQQALMAMGALIRQKESKRHYYDFRPEMSEELVSSIESVNDSIGMLTSTEHPTKTEILNVYDAYNQLATEEKRYVKNYADLSELLRASDIPIDSSDFTSDSIGKSADTNDEIALPSVEEVKTNQEAVKKLPDKIISLSSLPLIYSTYYQMNQLPDGTVSKSDKDLLKHKMSELEQSRKRIDVLSKDIKDTYYPLEDVQLSDYLALRKTLSSLNELSEEDKKLVFDYEDVERTEAMMATKIRSVLVASGIAVGMLAGLVFVIVRRKKRKKEKIQAMLVDEDEEYEDE